MQQSGRFIVTNTFICKWRNKCSHAASDWQLKESCDIFSHPCSSCCDSLSTEAQMQRMKTGRGMTMPKWLCNTCRCIKQWFGPHNPSLWRDRDVTGITEHGYTWRDHLIEWCKKLNQRKGNLGTLQAQNVASSGMSVKTVRPTFKQWRDFSPTRYSTLTGVLAQSCFHKEDWDTAGKQK